MSETSKSIPESWCKACRILHSVNLGFRPYSHLKRKARHPGFFSYFYPTRLTQEENLVWARSKRCVEYVAYRIKSQVPIQTRNVCEFAPFFDRLWCRALSSNASNGDSPCKFCSTSCPELYGVTLGPISTTNSPVIKVCGPCILRCRAAAIRVAEKESSEANDSLCKWFISRTEGSSGLCECSSPDSKCDLCFTVESLKFLYEQLKSSIDDGSNKELIPLGSPLFFCCCRPLPENIPKGDKEIESRLIHENLPCVVCQTASGNMLQLNNMIVVCEDCTLAYKAALTLLTVRVKEQNLSDLALLASLMALPCKDSGHPIDQTPLWAVCLPCHARRCLRLLHPLEPSLDWSAWLKRRAQLVFYRASSSNKSVTLCDLDPTISLTMKEHKRRKRLSVVTDLSAREKVMESTETIPLPVELTLPETFEDENSFVSFDSSTPSSIYTDSEPEPQDRHEEKENVEEKLKGSASPAASSITSLRDRRSRRLTARYAEALKEKESTATTSTTANRRRPRNGSESIATLRSLASPTVTISTFGEEDEEDQPRPSKRQKLTESPEKPVIVEGKRKPKANAKYLQGDFITLDSTGKWESGGVAFVDVDDVKSDVSFESAQIRKQNRRQSAQQPQPTVGRSGPRVKMVNRKPPSNNQLSSPMSIMKHAAKLAAVGAQRQDGTSPFMAASAATAEAYISDTGSVDGGNRLKADCGNCAACRGLATPCGRCVNCRKQAHYGGVGSSSKNRPCIATICQRRRHLMASKLDGPRVKIPSKFSPRSYQKSNLSTRNVAASLGLGKQPSLFDTVPGLEDQIMNIASPLLRSELTPFKIETKSATPVPVVDALESDEENASEDTASESSHPAINYPTRCLDVYADAPARSLRGGDLGMYFESRDSTEDDTAFRSVVPVEGEVIDSHIAHRGGFPVITTSAAAPPKEICYLCGSAGVDLQYCRVCAEPYHAFCDRFQSITKGDKENFVCSNCIPCEVCNMPGVELRCSKCLHGYHPVCLSGYAPTRNRGKGKFVCPHCTECVHCLVTPYGDYPEKMRSLGDKELIVPWSRNPSKCADCAKAETKGEVCPVCYRAYGTQPLELIRCDACEQWMHTSCAQFSIDQFELMRLYPKQLRNYVILCTACEPNQEKFLKKSKGGDKKQLCQLMCTALTARLNALVDACAMQPLGGETSSYHHQYAPSSTAFSSTTANRRSFAPGSPLEYTASSYRYMHQMDGMHDDDEDDFHHDQQIEAEVEGEYEGFEVGEEEEGEAVEFHSPDEQISEVINQEAYVPSWLLHGELAPPPARADWLLDSLGSEFWITPKTLSFILLARVVSRIERNPPSTSDYMLLRKLLHWLATSIQTLFPWLDSSASVKEVRSLLHQRKGSLPVVEDFLRSAAEIELYELACPFVTALTCQIRRMNIFQANQTTPPRKFGYYQTCIEKVRHHITTYHPDFTNIDRKFDTAQEAFTKLRVRNADCCNPAYSSLNIHSEQIISDTTTDETLISNFQKELFLKWQRQLHCPSRRAVLKALLEGRTMPYYFAVKLNWDALNATYASQMVPISSKSTVDLDESDSEAPDVEIRALPEEIIDQEEKALFDPSVEPRRCLLCARHTDASIEDRLIYIGSDTWVHVNCALWSKEVFEEDSGQLTGLSAALRRGCRSFCKDCGRTGATMSCSNTSSCDVVVHFPCAMSRWKPTHSKPVFTAGRSFFCSPECFTEARATRFVQSIKKLRSKKVESLYKYDEDELERKKAAIKEDIRGADELIAEWEISQEEMDSIRSEIEWEMAGEARLRVSKGVSHASPELREMLVCRRVFVPSDCFVVSLRDDGFDQNEEQEEGSSVDENYETDDYDDEDRKAVKCPSVLSLAISVNTLAFASYKLPASAFVVTIGSLHIDRLGHIAEASDSLCREKPNFLCPVGYRARRFYWSVADPNVLEPYTLTISQAPKDSVKTNNLSSAATASYQRSILPHVPTSRSSNAYTPIASKPLEPGTKLVPSLSAGRSTSTYSSLAYDPYPNNPTGLPLIRFTYTQGTPPNRTFQKTSISPQQQTQQQQSSTSVLQTTVTSPSFTQQQPRVVQSVVMPQQQPRPQMTPYQPSAAQVVVSSPVQPATFVPTRHQPIVSSPPPRVKPVTVVNASAGGSMITSVSSISSGASPVAAQKSQSLILTRPSVQPVQAGAPTFSNVSFPPRATVPKIVGAVSLSKPSKTQQQQTSNTTRSITTTVSTPLTSSPATAISSSGPTVQMTTPLNVVQKRTGLQAQLAPSPPTSTVKRPVNVYRSIPSGSLVRMVTTTTSSTAPSQAIRSPFVVRAPLSTATPRGPVGPALRPVRLFTSATKPLVVGAVDASTTPTVVTVNPAAPTAHRLIRPPIVTRRIVRPSGPITVVQSPTPVTPGQPGLSQEQNPENVPSSQPQIRQLDGLDDSDEFINMPLHRVGNGKSIPQKRKWMTEQENRRALQESVQKARQVANERMYQKEASLFANSFQLIFTAKSSKENFFTPTAAWRDVVSVVADARRARNILFAVPPLIDGWAQFGLNHRHVIFLLEQLPGAHTCLRYHFRYHRYRIDQIREKYEPPHSNLCGAARLIPYEKDPKRSEMARDPLAFLMCKANRAPRSCLPLHWPGEKNGRSVRGGASTDSLPSSSAAVAHGRFPSACIDAARQAASIVANSLNISPRLHARTVEAVVAEATADMVEEAEAGRSKQLASLTHQLRNIPTSREARMWRVAVCPSRIHKRGLFALCSFRPGELICEYTGELVSNMVCDKREAMYRAKGVDCYFFRISENLVVDATYAGNYARFINHSCQPNCGAQIVGKNHIVITANRRILPGEELTYDYQFPKETENVQIHILHSLISQRSSPTFIANALSVMVVSSRTNNSIKNQEAGEKSAAKEQSRKRERRKSGGMKWPEGPGIWCACICMAITAVPICRDSVCILLCVGSAVVKVLVCKGRGGELYAHQCTCSEQSGQLHC
ncbi:hypothetical protein ACTXT7_011057 [Hymenolepis weldensis]